ncbi:MAG: LysM domain-containing protein [Proteobacteria bacterium]|nr:LysM domain-containing protein [Pseudomonadota bacterium]
MKGYLTVQIKLPIVQRILFFFVFLILKNGVVNGESTYDEPPREKSVQNSFSGVPPMPGSRKTIPRGDAPDFYTVEAGDTLFDICSQIVDNGDYWPKLWSFNADVKNPHFIYPGMKLAFFSGDAETPPYLEVVEEDDMVPVDKGALKEAELVVQDSEVPAYQDSPSNLSAVGALAGEQTSDFESKGTSEVQANSDFIDVGSGYSGTDVNLVVPSSLVQGEPQINGRIIEGAKGEVNSGDGVVVKLSAEETLVEGTRYSVFRLREKVYHPETKEFIADRFDFCGNIIVKKKVGSLGLATVVDSQHGVMNGDIVLNFVSTKRNLSDFRKIGKLLDANATIIGLHYFNQSFVGEGNFVFLDKGSLSPGQFFSIYQQVSNHSVFADSSDALQSTSRKVGVVRIVDSNSFYSLGVIVVSQSEIRIGDRLTQNLLK